MARSGIGAIHRADPSGLIVRPPPRHTGLKSRDEAKRASAARTAALFFFPGGPPVPRRGRGGKSPKGRAQEARAFAVGTGMCRQRTAAASSRSRRLEPATAVPGVPFSLVTFSWASKRKWLARQGWRVKKHRDVRRVSRDAPRAKGEELDPGFRRDDDAGGLSPGW